MRKILSTLLLGFCLTTTAQDCNITIVPIVTPTSENEHSAQVEQYLSNRLSTLVNNSSGISGVGENQFAIAASYDILGKSIVPGSPVKIVYDLQVTLFIVDLKGKTIFTSYTTELKGVGDNETKALINVFRRLNINNKDILAFVSQGRDKIIAYYDKAYPQIIASAKLLAAMKNYDAAINKLMSVPECCKGYPAVSETLKQVYQQFVNQHCNENLAQARAAWIASPNSEGASTAGVFLSEIYPDAACYQDAMALFTDIKKRMGDIWKFEMKRWNDSISLEQQRINAMRDISIAYANAQAKQEVTVFWK